MDIGIENTEVDPLLDSGVKDNPGGNAANGIAWLVLTGVLIFGSLTALNQSFRGKVLAKLGNLTSGRKPVEPDEQEL
jgi:hypothetical protein